MHTFMITFLFGLSHILNSGIRSILMLFFHYFKVLSNIYWACFIKTSPTPPLVSHKYLPALTAAQTPSDERWLLITKRKHPPALSFTFTYFLVSFFLFHFQSLRLWLQLNVELLKLTLLLIVGLSHHFPPKAQTRHYGVTTWNEKR